MKGFQYSRLSPTDPETKTYKFSALDGPSFFTYGVPAGKYSSAFTYTQQKNSDGFSMNNEQSGTTGHYGSAELYSTSNSSS